MIRGDLSNRLIHLTKGKNIEEAGNTFVQIMREAQLRGGNGYIRGGHTCICFSEAPISVLSQILSNADVNEMRYAPFGVMVRKNWLFEKGGRPVIYQAHEEYDLLPDAIKYRHVRYDPLNGVDHTWEREWRISIETLALDTAATTFVVPTRDWEDRFKDQHAAGQAAWAASNGHGSGIRPFPWHFIVLEDLGVEFRWE
ncbi:MAG: hypothetical protein ACXWAT_14475 [Methylobacter sp.]